MRKYLLGVIYFGLVSGSSLFAEQSLHSGSFGCNCDALKVCRSFDCGPQCGFCADDSGRKCSICLCRAGGMKHCSNFAQILNDPKCADLKKEYCDTQDGDGPKICQNDPACN